MKLTWGVAVLLTVVGLIGSLNLATAQEVTAAITGTVVDSSGAALKGASVAAKDTERGTVWTAQTNDAGVFNLTRLPVGNYSVRVSAPGFQTETYPTFTLVLNQTASLNFQMKVGQTSETVEVSAEAPLLQTQSTEVSTLIDAATTVSMPLASRNYLQLTLLAPGATNVDPDGMRQVQSMTNSGRPYINGNREQANEYLLDGILNSEDKNDEVGYTPGIDAIQEFNLITQNASAEFGNYQGGIISATIKSGTNNIHGDVFEFFRNDALDANKASAGWTQGVDNGVKGFNAQGVQNKPEFRYNQFGGTIGGPIIKNKLFFFADYQGQRLVNAGNTGAQVLTASARAGNFGQLCVSGFSGGVCQDAALGPNALDLDSSGHPKNTAPVAGNQLVVPNSGGNNKLFYFNPAEIPAGGTQPTIIKNNNLAAAGLAANTVAANLFSNTKLYPLPQVDALAGNNIFYNSGNDLNNNQGDLKIDFVASQKDHIFGRWSQMDLNQPTFTGCVACNAGAVEGTDEPVRNFALDWTHALNPNLLNEARVGFNAVRFDSRETPTSSLGNISQQLGISGGNLQAPGLVQISIAGVGVGAEASLGLANLIQVFHSTQLQFEDNLIWTRGRHQIKTGFQFARDRQDYIYQGNNGALGTLNIDSLTGSSLADFYLGNVASAQSFRDTGGVISSPAKLRGNIFGAYVQDDWRVTNTLTVNLGLRFEDHTPLYEVNNRTVNFGLLNGTIYTADGRDGTAKFGNRALYNNYLGIGDWMPRVGIAWSPAALHGRDVIRAGFGISSFTEGGGSNEELTLNVPFGILQQQAPGGVGTLGAGFGPTLPNPCPVINQTCYNGNRIRVFDQNFKPAMIYQWNLTLQHQFSNTLTFQIGYVGQRGAHLLNFQDNAQSIPLDANGKIAGAGDPIVKLLPGPFLGGGTPGSLYLADNPQFNAAGCGTTILTNPPCGHEALVGTNMSNSDQKYNALQAVLQKRMSNGLQAQIAYTWSKCMSNSPGFFGTGFGSTQATSSGGQPGWENIYNPRLDWGPCYYDQTNIVTSYVTYALPIGHGKRFGHDMNPVLNNIIGNWEIGSIVTLHSGNALTLNEFGGWGLGGNADNTNGVDPFTLAGLPNCNGPIKVLKQHVNANTLQAGQAGFIQWFDTSNISNPAPNSFGTCGVGNIRGPAYANFDLSLHKDFLVTETKRLEFRFEALNAFNHPVWTFFGGPANGSFDPGASTGPSGGPLSSNQNFGRIADSQGARQLQFALKFYF
jgi:Carboxypeptidase regulatory-like domain/TonB dependent receptor